MANSDEFHQGLRFKRVGSGLGAIDITDTTTVGMNLTAPNADVSINRNEPFALFKSDTETFEKLGLTGTAALYLDTFLKGVAGGVVVVNVFEEGADADATMANAIGSRASLSGIHALNAAEGHIGLKPKIIMTPTFTNYRVDGAANPVAIEQGLIAKQLGAVHLVSGPATTEEDAVAFRGDFDDARMIITDPMVKTASGLMTTEAHMAAIGVTMDKEVGFHASWGNQILSGALGVNRVTPHSITESDTRANYLLSNQVNTIINQDGGWRSWGDYAATTDTAKQFYCQTRVEDIVNEALAKNLWRVISNPLIADKVTAMLDRMNEFFSGMVSDGYLLGGEAKFEGDRNSIGALELGKIVLKTERYSPPPVTLIDIENEPAPRFLSVVVQDILANSQFSSAS